MIRDFEPFQADKVEAWKVFDVAYSSGVLHAYLTWTYPGPYKDRLHNTRFEHNTEMTAHPDKDCDGTDLLFGALENRQDALAVCGLYSHSIVLPVTLLDVRLKGTEHVYRPIVGDCQKSTHETYPALLAKRIIIQDSHSLRKQCMDDLVARHLEQGRKTSDTDINCMSYLKGLHRSWAYA